MRCARRLAGLAARGGLALLGLLGACSEDRDPIASAVGSAQASSAAAGGGGPSANASATSGSGGQGGSAGGAPAGARGLWVWQSGPVVDAAERSALFAFCEAQKLATVFVESEGLVTGDPAALGAFIEAADERGLGVELLFGNADWVLPGGHAYALSLAQAGIALAASLPGAKPVGLHFDVEPHTLADWSADPAGVAGPYLDLLDSLARLTSGTGLRLSVDVAFWYDGVEVPRGGQTRPLSEWVIDAVDRVVVMSYRDHAAAPDGLIDLVDDEVAYASSQGKGITLGVETTCGLTPTKVTFCEEGSAAMEQALSETLVHFSGQPLSVAVHDYAAWQSLAP